MSRLLAWIMLAVWASWLSALQGLLVTHTTLGLWVPDLGLVLALSCLAAFDRRDGALCALIAAMGRIAFSVEPPAAVLAGFLFAGLVVRAVATVAEVEGPLVRTTTALVCAWGLAAWFLLVHQVRDGAREDPLAIVPEALAAWPLAVSSALVALLFHNRLVRLPGLSPLRKPRW